MTSVHTKNKAGKSPGPPALNMFATTKNQLQDLNNDYVYDAAGNLIQPGTSGGTYTFDAENHLTSAGGIAYLYDGDGKRVAKAPANTPTQPNYLYWYGTGSQILEETDGAGNYEYFNAYFNGMLLARGEPDNWVDHFFLDALGNVRVVYGDGDPDGGTSDYYPFGGERPITTGGVNVPFKFTGKERDSESGLDNFGARYDSSSLGRFMSPDAVRYSRLTDPQTWNLYSYVANNPLNKIDLDGHDWFYVDKKWQWQKGHTFHDKDGNATKDKGYRYLLEFKKTGVNKEGAAVGTLTLHDQNTIAAQSQAFSGGHGFSIIPNGNFTIRLDIRGQAADASSIKANQEELRQFYGIQQISPVVTDSNGQPAGGSGDFRYEWGSIRAALNEPAGETRPEFQGNYLHGKNRTGDYTHGCICERSENILHFLLQNINPTEDPKVPVSVQ
jgi:RHS repeat-associated protein